MIITKPFLSMRLLNQFGLFLKNKIINKKHKSKKFLNTFLIVFLSVLLLLTGWPGIVEVRAVSTIIWPSAKHINDTSTADLNEIKIDDAACNPDTISGETASDGCYTVDKNSILYIDTFDISAIPVGSTITAAVLHLQFGAEDGANPSNSVRYDNGGGLTNTTITPSDISGWSSDQTYDLYAQGVDTLSELGAVDIEYTNNDAAGPDAISFDYVYIAITYTLPSTTYTQNDFRWYKNADSVTLSDLWGSVITGDNQDIPAIPTAYNPPGVGEQMRLQVNITVGLANLSASTQAFKLQFKTGTDQDCSTGSWTDVGAKGSTTVAWRFFDNSSLSDNTSEVNQISTSDVVGGYSETNPTGTNPNAVNVGQDMEWDFPIESVSGQVADATTYAFRIVKSDGSTISYTPGDCPTVETEPGTANLMRHGNFFIDGIKKAFFWAD